MPKELTEAEKALHEARRRFVELSVLMTKSLTTERKRLARQIAPLNARVKRLSGQIAAKTERLSATTLDRTRETLNKQLAELKALRDSTREDTRGMRAELALVRTDLASARDHFARALHIDKALARLEQQWEKATHRKAKKKTVRRKKTAKVAAKKRTAKKRTAKKRTAKKAAAVTRARKKPATAKRARATRSAAKRRSVKAGAKSGRNT